MNAPRTSWRASTVAFVPTLLWALILGSVFAGFPFQRSVFAQTKPSRLEDIAVARDPLRATSRGYVGSEACARCHLNKYRSFLHTRMGRSLTDTNLAHAANLPLPGSYYNSTLDRHFEIFARNGKLFQSEYQTDAGGAEIFRSTQEVRWIVGAGANGYSALVQQGDYLMEAPLSYYIRTGKWEPSPGYEAADTGFSRPVLAGCISCHSGRANPADQDTGKFAAVPFTQISIGCENCHGPGAAHVRAESAGGRVSDPQIVDPGKLTARLENDICMSCHEAGDARVLHPGKTFQDFRPGTSLDETVSIFMVPLKRGDPDNRDHVQHYFEMSMSKCFRATNGELRCATCHDPHVEPTAAQAPDYFNTRCMNCHATNHTCTAPAAARAQTTPADNCIGCHMPQRAASETAHTSLTNHRILARPGEPWPDEAFEQTSAALPDLVHLNRAPGRPDSVPALTLLEAYRELAERRPAYAPRYDQVLDQLEQSDPNHVEVQLGLSRRALKRGDATQAVAHLEQATQLDPQRGAAYADLARALAQQGRLSEAVAASEMAVHLTPFNPLYQKTLIDQLIAAQQYDKATAAMDRYVALFPQDGFMRKMLALAKQ